MNVDPLSNESAIYDFVKSNISSLIVIPPEDRYDLFTLHDRLILCCLAELGKYLSEVLIKCFPLLRRKDRKRFDEDYQAALVDLGKLESLSLKLSTGLPKSLPKTLEEERLLIGLTWCSGLLIMRSN